MSFSFELRDLGVNFNLFQEFWSSGLAEEGELDFNLFIFHLPNVDCLSHAQSNT